MTWQVREWSGNRLERSTVAFTGTPVGATQYYRARCAKLRRGFVMLIGADGHAVETRHAPKVTVH
jgi:hypothetical protein